MYKTTQHETSTKAWYFSIGIATLVFLLTLSYFVLYRNLSLSMTFINISFAIGAVFLIGASFVLGPLAGFFPKLFIQKLEYRKSLGLLGYSFAIIHIILSLLTAGADVYETSRLSLAFGMLAILIFTAVAMSSMVKSVDAFGFERWQKIQRTGYIAFFFVMLHFALLENGVFLTRQLGQVTFAFVLLVLGLRILILFTSRKK